MVIKFKRKIALLLSGVLTLTPVSEVTAQQIMISKNPMEYNLQIQETNIESEESIKKTEAESEEAGKSQETEYMVEDMSESVEAESGAETESEETNSQESMQSEVFDVETDESSDSNPEMNTDETDEASETDLESDITSEAAEEKEIPDVEKLLNYMDVEGDEAGTPDKTAFNDEVDCLTSVELPAKYDGRTQGCVSSVKSQNPFGSCWSFAAVALAESAYMRLYGKEADLSESHLVEFFYNGEDADLYTDESDIGGDKNSPVGNTQEDRGGNTLYTTPVLAAWKGIADESVDDSLKYETMVKNNEVQIDSKYAFTDVLHLENAYFIPITDTEGVKNAVMEYGGVATAYYYSSTYDSYYYDGEAYYCPVNKGGTNHAVTIVGWDDNYSIDNFKTTSYYKAGNTTLPENNGAWLVKNSWGTDYHDNGYFWMSYEDVNIASTAYAYDFGRADNYDYNYQYDGGAASALYRNLKKTAAIYEATGNQDVEAIGIMLRTTDVDYTARVYTGITDMKNPESGTLVHTQTGRTTYEGYHTIELTDSIKIPKGEKFSVVLEYKDRARVAADMSSTSNSWIHMNIDYEDEYTFYSTGSSWVRLTDEHTTMRMKAYTNKSTALFENMVGDIDDYEYTGQAITPPVTVTTSDGLVLTEGVDYTLEYSDNINVGKAAVTIAGKGVYSDSVTIYFNIIPITLKEAMLEAPDKIYDGNAYAQADIIIEDKKISEENFTITYYKDVCVEENRLASAPVNAGKYVVVVEGKNVCTGKIQKSFNIKAMEVEAVLTTPDKIYDGNAYNDVKVVAGGKELTALDYTLIYYAGTVADENRLESAPVNAGKYVVVAQLKGNYSGSGSAEFDIIKIEVEIQAPDMIYNSKAYSTPKFEFSANGNKIEIKDYSITYYEQSVADENRLESAPVNAGQYVVQVQAGDTYNVRGEAEFKILPQTLTLATATGKYDNDNNFVGLTVIINGINLNENDYVVQYENIEGSVFDEIPVKSGKYVARITGKGNYKDEIVADIEIPYKSLTAEIFDIKDMVYNAAVQEGVILKTNRINPNNFEIKYNKQPLNAGAYTVSIIGKGDYEGTITFEFSIEKLTLTEDMVTEISDQTYTGTAIKPDIELKVDGNVLPKTDYTVKYADNKNAGTATIVIQGKKNCEGTITRTFEILPKSVETLEIDVADAIYTGKPQMPQVTVKDGTKKLKEDKDFTISYGENNTDADNILTDSSNPQVTVTGCGNYAGNRRVSFVIEPLTVKARDVVVHLSYDENDKVSLNAYIKDTKLKYDIDFTAEIINQTTKNTVSDINEVNSKDKYTVWLNFKGNYYSKEPVAVKNISCKKDLKDYEIRFIEDGQYVSKLKPAVYNGKAHKPKLALVSGENILNKSNYKITYQNNIAAGVATVIVSGKGQYSGTVSSNFEICTKELGKDIRISGLNDKIYTGKEIKPSVSIKGLKSGRDFKIIGYKNNINANHTGDSVPQVVIELSDNYTVDGQKMITKEFNIKPAKITSVKVAKGYYQNGEAVQPALTVKAGKLVLSENDYTVKWENNKEIGKASATVSVNNQNGNFYILKPIRVSFKISKESLSEARLVQIKTPVYTGTTIDFDKYYKLYDQSGNLIENDEYEITPDKQIAAGNVTVTFKAKTDSRFTGRKTVKCKVEAAYIGDYLELTQTGLPVKYYYNGKEITFTKKELKAAFKDKVTGEAILPDSFTVKYENNKEAGQAKLYITGKKNYGGTMVINFDIKAQE